MHDSNIKALRIIGNASMSFRLIDLENYGHDQHITEAHQFQTSNSKYLSTQRIDVSFHSKVSYRYTE